jgi:cellulose synthase/poly-beta-1,6-N-acetylglucosamine synthase-like glycosyltransferase
MAAIFWGSVVFIAYVYAGYPLALALLAKLLRNPLLPKTSALPSVTLLIAANNEAATIAQKLENALDLDFPSSHLQILVSDDGSVDATAGIVNQFSQRGVELVSHPQRSGKTSAINRAMAAATGQIVVISDANNSYAPDALRQLVAPFADPRVGAVAGAKIIIKGESALGNAEGRYWHYEDFIKRRETEISSCIGATGEILAFRRERFEPFPAHILHDDLYLALKTLKQGCRVIYAPQAQSFERISANPVDEITRRRRLIVGRLQIMTAGLMPWRHPVLVWQITSHKFMRPFIIWAMAAVLITNIFAVIWPPSGGLPQLAPPWNWSLLIGQAGFYLAAFAGNRFNPRGLLKSLLYIPTFLVNSNWASALGMWDYFRGHRAKTWTRVPRQDWVSSDDEPPN